MRVTGDCFLAVRLPGRLAAAFFAPLERAATFGALFRFAVVVFAAGLALFFLLAAPALLLLRAAVPLDAAVDLRRDFPPDDFDLVAIIEFLEEGTERSCARFARSAESAAIATIAVFDGVREAGA
jgi:hypothetical protein